MATKTWTGAGANNNWNTALNWSGGTVPAIGDDVIFDGVAANGKKNCTLVGPSGAMLSVTFTSGYTNAINPLTEGTFTFSASLTVTGTITLGVNTIYATSGTVTTYTLNTSATGMTLVSNGKILPVNFATNGGTTTINGNADFQGNFASTSIAHNIKSATGVPADLRIGGNISLLAITTNTTDTVTFKAYGTAKTFASNSANTNARVNFVLGSTYTNTAANLGISGTSFLTVEAGGQFNALNNTNSFVVSGTLTLSGFNGLSDFVSISASGTYILSNDTVIKGFINIAATCIISTSTGAKILLEGNLTSSNNSTLTIDKLEFSGTTSSNITASTSANNLQVKEFIINKTGGGSVNFNTAGIFALFVPSTTTYLFTYTNGIVTQSSNCVIRFSGNNATATTTYSATSPLNTLRYLEIFGGTLNLNTQLTVTTFKITPNTNPTTITSPSTFGFTVEELKIFNVSGVTRTITLKSGNTYTITTSFIADTITPTAITTLNASTPGTRANFNIEPGGLPSVDYVNATDIDSSGTNGVLPFTKVPIYSFGGTIAATTRNWSTGNKPPPLTPSKTVAYTFVN
jgi:hypothetical protein